MRILIVEDEIGIVEPLKFFLEKSGFIVDYALNGEDGLDLCYGEIYDVIVLDIMLPKIDGISILKKIRKDKINTPVIILSAKDTVEDRILGLDEGADDYLIKPFHTPELVARLKALGRRKHAELLTNTFEIQDIIFDPSQLLIKNNKEEINLTFKESQILELLFINLGNTITKDKIYEKVWGYDSEIESNSLEAYISYIRKKLDRVTKKIKLTAVRGVGYKLEEVLC
ncbi:MAG: response regulator transcription factor [Lachnospirales bacterium]